MADTHAHFFHVFCTIFILILCICCSISHVLGHSYNIVGEHVTLNSNEMEIGDCSNPNSEDLLYYGNNSLPARSSIDAAVTFSTTFSTRGSEIIYCLMLKGNDDTAITITAGGINSQSVTFVQNCNAGRSSEAVLLVYGR
ncbi:uncharacterized protein LOC132703543 [Cylas formicarius]|uniref:uncharacterized protein LOC132703543 n=1 Tax=Cylas formicarius TaxID=197179 RepID=UPI00295893F6|nr:uncharacterized protein LOC132703543 [Cylas formicarius]